MGCRHRRFDWGNRPKNVERREGSRIRWIRMLFEGKRMCWSGGPEDSQPLMNFGVLWRHFNILRSHFCANVQELCKCANFEEILIFCANSAKIYEYLVQFENFRCIRVNIFFAFETSFCGHSFFVLIGRTTHVLIKTVANFARTLSQSHPICMYIHVDNLVNVNMSIVNDNVNMQAGWLCVNVRAKFLIVFINTGSLFNYVVLPMNTFSLPCV